MQNYNFDRITGLKPFLKDLELNKLENSNVEFYKKSKIATRIKASMRKIGDFQTVCYGPLDSWKNGLDIVQRGFFNR